MSSQTSVGSSPDTTDLVRTPHLALFETGGNQAYVFGTNRLRENLGASELLSQSCTTWVSEAAAHLVDCRVITATSGRALVWCKDDDQACKLVGDVTMRALVDAPGLVLAAAHVEWDPSNDLGEQVRALIQQCEQAAGATATGAARFLRLPIVAPCESTGLPAERSVRIGGGHEATARLLSEVAWAKLCASSDARKRLKLELDLQPPADIEELETMIRRRRDVGWLAVIHADGNGIGNSFISLDGWVREQPNMDADKRLQKYLAVYTEFSQALEEATTDALREAVKKVRDCLRDDERAAASNAVSATQGSGQPHPPEDGNDETLPILPLVVGGDDVAVIIDARYALDFTETLLNTFASDSRPTEVLLRHLPEAQIPPHFTMGAGVAIVKPHFPFHAAYELADQLADVAKAATKEELAAHEVPGEVGVPAGSLDFHMLSDSTGTTLDEIRASRRSDDGQVALWGGPYLVRVSSDTSKGGTLRDLHQFRQALALVATNEDDQPTVSRSSINKVRVALFDTEGAAATANDYLDRPLPEELFDWRDSGPSGKPQRSTILIDVVDVADLWFMAPSDRATGGGA